MGKVEDMGMGEPMGVLMLKNDVGESVHREALMWVAMGVGWRYGFNMVY